MPEVHGSMLRDIHYTDSGCTFSSWVTLKRIQYQLSLDSKIPFFT